MPVDIPALGCDFYAFTGHKLCGPTGTGALWAKREHWQSMPPFFGGGEMIREVRFEKTTFNDPPHKFEAGTPNIAGFIGLGAAVSYLDGIGMIKDLRASLPAGRDVHFMILTGDASSELCGDLADIPIFLKPADTDALVAAIRAVLVC